MCVLPELTRQRTQLQLQSAAAVLFSRHSGFERTPTELARSSGVDRSTIYRQAHRLQQRLSSIPHLQARVSDLSTQNFHLQQHVQQLEAQLAPYQDGHWVKVTPQRFAMATLEMAARAHSIEDTKAVLQTTFALDKPPADGTLFSVIDQGARIAEQIIDTTKHPYPLDTIEFDELFHANQPLLAVVEPYSMALVLLEQFDNCRAHTWKFAFEYRGIEPPERMVHDCSKQGNLLTKLLSRESQLCLFHRQRNIKQQLQPQLDKLFEKACEELDEPTWLRAEFLEKSLLRLEELTHPIDFSRRKIRRFDQACEELEAWCVDFRAQVAALGLTCPTVSHLQVRVEQYLNHLKLWETLAQEVAYTDGFEEVSGFVLLDAHIRVMLGVEELETLHRWEPNSESYWQAQADFVKQCALLKTLQARVQNNGYIKRKIALYLRDLVRTTSRTEALNRRLRGFADAKRQVTERQLRLMHLHHNTTRFTADAKRAGKSPWEWLKLDIPGLEDGFVGVMMAASEGISWPSPWVLKSKKVDASRS